MANPADVSVRVDGLDRLRKTMKRAGADLDDLKNANAAVATMVAGVAASRAPRRTGALAGTVRGNRAQRKAQVLVGKKAVPYGIFVHEGTTHVPARPFASEAAQATEPRWVAMYRAETVRIVATIRGA